VIGRLPAGAGALSKEAFTAAALTWFPQTETLF
jgi:hypothetical protein